MAQIYAIFKGDSFMKKMFAVFMLIAVSVFGANISQTLYAQGAHEHGIAKLNVAVDGQSLTIELESPLANMVSFEHEPTTEEQKKEVSDMAGKLRRADEIFVPSQAAECRLTQVKLESDALDEALLSAENSGRPDDHDHEAEGGSSGHKGHDHDGDIDDDAHGEIEGEFVFSCARPDKLDSMEVKLFDHFSGFHKINVQLVSPKGQKAFELAPKSAKLAW
jgi:hypothetical protein